MHLQNTPLDHKRNSRSWFLQSGLCNRLCNTSLFTGKMYMAYVWLWLMCDNCFQICRLGTCCKHSADQQLQRIGLQGAFFLMSHNPSSNPRCTLGFIVRKFTGKYIGQFLSVHVFCERTIRKPPNSTTKYHRSHQFNLYHNAQGGYSKKKSYISWFTASHGTFLSNCTNLLLYKNSANQQAWAQSPTEPQSQNRWH